MQGNLTDSPSPAPPEPAGGTNGHSTSVMFIIYMLIGFTVTLACIVVLTLLYFLIRCFLRRGGRTVDSDPEGSESSLALPPREIYLVVHPGGTTTVAYRDDEVLELKPRDKRSQCKRIVIELEARTPSSATSADFLIAASRPSAHARASSPPSATSGGTPDTAPGWSRRMLLFQGGTPAAAPSPFATSTDSAGTSSYDNEVWESAGSFLDSSPSQASSLQASGGEVIGRLSFSPPDSSHSSSQASSGQATQSSCRSGTAQDRRGSNDAPTAPEPAGQPTGLRCSPDAAGSHQLGSGDGHRLVEVELLCLSESLSDSGSPPHIYFNSLFMPEAQTGERTEAGPGATPDAGS